MERFAQVLGNRAGESHFQDFEIIVVDDASTDDTLEQLSLYCDGSADISIRVIQSDRNVGPAGARNLGIDAAEGELICFIDSDCTVDPQWLSRLLAPMEDPSVGATCGAVVEAPAQNWPEHALAGEAYYGHKGDHLHEANMAVRRVLAQECRFDAALRYGAAGDDLARRIKADGWTIAFAGDARVTHHRSLTIADYLRRAYMLGQGSARYWYKHNIFVGRDLLALACAVLAIPLVAIDSRLVLVSVAFIGLQIAAIAYNELYFKGKTIARTIHVFPLLLLRFAWRAVGVGVTLTRILFGSEEEIRRSKRSCRNLEPRDRTGDAHFPNLSRRR